MGRYVAKVKETKKLILVTAKTAAGAKKWVKKMGLTLKGSVQAVHSFTKKKR